MFSNKGPGGASTPTGALSQAYKVKSADQSVISSTTYVDATDLEFAVEAGGVYEFEHVLLTETGATGIFKAQLFASATVNMGATNWGTGAGSPSSFSTGSSVVAASTAIVLYVSAGQHNRSIGRGFIYATNAATMKVQFAQVASEAVNTTLKAGSFIKVTRVK